MKTSPLFLALALSVPWLAASAQAAVIPVSAGADLQTAIDQAQAGDTLRLASGGYAGKIVINKPLTLEGGDKRDAVIQGDRTGRTITVAAPHVTIKHLTVTKSGISLPNMDAGIFLDKAADAAHIVENNILDNSVGVYLWGAPNALVERNTIIGNKELRENERGNGVTVWNAPNSKVVYNDISHGRDGIFSNASNFNTFSHNHFHDLRYGVHYMYTNDSQIEGNIVSNSKIGYAIMFSTNIKLRDNVSYNNIDQGIMLNYANDSIIDGNAVEKSPKCVYLYNANNNQFTRNHFEGCEIGIHFSGAAEGNTIRENAFVNNHIQIKYVGTRFVDWAEGQKYGNYWSDNSAFDLDGDG
ncbi:nitrous oxide reductase family maturation protein NosD, partial [Kingella oralis]|uniref:nitrous oxide reductase family maturation protein NosD n=1 Tax=Kingella oralis TaxID=505 RepID=UPI0034E56E7F